MSTCYYCEKPRNRTENGVPKCAGPCPGQPGLFVAQLGDSLLRPAGPTKPQAELLRCLSEEIGSKATRPESFRNDKAEIGDCIKGPVQGPGDEDALVWCRDCGIIAPKSITWYKSRLARCPSCVSVWRKATEAMILEGKGQCADFTCLQRGAASTFKLTQGLQHCLGCDPWRKVRESFCKDKSKFGACTF